MSDQPRCESHLEDERQCENDAVGKYYVELDYDGEFYQGEFWLCDEHKTAGEPLETPNEVDA